MPVRRRTPGRPLPRRRSARAERLRLRWATVDDLAVLVRHRRRMWEELRDFSSGDLDRHDAVYRRWARGLFARGKFLAAVVERPDGRVVGSGAVWLMPSQPRPGPLGQGELPYILSMYTEPEYRGRGIASRVVRTIVRWARAHRYGRVVLHASRFGRPVYARLGFQAANEMRLDLRRQPALRR